jgi:hypothetical protein
MEIYTVYHRVMGELIGSFTNKLETYICVFNRFSELHEIMNHDKITDHEGEYFGDYEVHWDYHVYRYNLDDYYEIDLKERQTRHSFSLPKTVRELKDEIDKLKRDKKIKTVLDE